MIKKTRQGDGGEEISQAPGLGSVYRVVDRNVLCIDGVYAIVNENYFTVPFLFLFVFGYWYTGLMSLLQGRFDALVQSRGEEHSAKPFPVGV